MTKVVQIPPSAQNSRYHDHEKIMNVPEKLQTDEIRELIVTILSINKISCVATKHVLQPIIEWAKEQITHIDPSTIAEALKNKDLAIECNSLSLSEHSERLLPLEKIKQNSLSAEDEYSKCHLAGVIISHLDEITENSDREMEHLVDWVTK